jgi:hypothetical protein
VPGKNHNLRASGNPSARIVLVITPGAEKYLDLKTRVATVLMLAAEAVEGIGEGIAVPNTYIVSITMAWAADWRCHRLAPAAQSIWRPRIMAPIMRGQKYCGPETFAACCGCGLGSSAANV